MIAPHKYLTYLYASALFVVAGSLILGQWLIQDTLATSQQDARRINLAGRQRMLSVQMVRDALQMQTFDPSDPQRREWAERSRQANQTLQQTHIGLLHGDPQLRLPATREPSEVEYFNRLAEPLLKMRDAASDLDPNDPAAVDVVDRLATAQGEFLPLMNALVYRMSHHADQRIVHAKRIELAILAVALIILAVEAMFVFRPAARRISQTIELLQQREQSLIRSERRQRDLVKHSAGAIICLHHQTGRISDVNPAAANQLKHPIEELVGKRFDAFLDGASTTALEENLLRLSSIDSCQCQLNILIGDGQQRLWLVRLSKYRREDDEPLVLLTAHDVTDQAERERRLVEINQRDALTGLYNRGELDRRIDVLSRLHQTQGVPFTLALIDIDHFKKINDQFGHQAGDEVLRAVSRIVESACRSADVVARYGGEEIAVLFPSLGYRDAEPIAGRIRHSIQNAVIAVGSDEHSSDHSDDQSGDEPRSIQTTVCIGLAGAPSHSTDGKELLTYADSALYTAKRSGRNAVVVATSPEWEPVVDRSAITSPARLESS